MNKTKSLTQLAQEANQSLIVKLTKIAVVIGLSITSGALGFRDAVNYMWAISPNHAYSLGLALLTPVLAYIFFAYQK